MSDEVQGIMEEDVAAGSGLPANEPRFPAASFVVAIGDRPVPTLWLGHFVERDEDGHLPPGAETWFIKGQHPHRHKFDIQRAAVKTKLERVKVERDGAPDTIEAGDVAVESDPDAAFIELCKWGITDYLLPGFDHNAGQSIMRKFNPKGSPRGDNRDNHEVYESIVDDPNQGLRRLVQEYLEWVAGMSPRAERDWVALGNAPGR